MKNVLGIIGTNKILSLIKGGLNSKEDNMVEVPESIITNEWNQNNTETSEILIAPEGEINKWDHELSDQTFYDLSISKYNEDEESVIVYDKYPENDYYFTRITDADRMFYNKTGIKYVKFGDYINLNEVESMYEMFKGCSSLLSIDFGKSIDDSRINIFMDISSMFENCSNLVSLNVSKFNTSSIKGFTKVFAGCSSLESLDLTSWDTHKAEFMYRTFYGCTNLKEIKVSRSKWVISDSCNTTDMFTGCGTDHVTYVD